MDLDKKNIITIINDKIDYSFLSMCNDAKLIYVNGSGKLKTSTSSVEDSYYGMHYETDNS